MWVRADGGSKARSGPCTAKSWQPLPTPGPWPACGPPSGVWICSRVSGPRRYDSAQRVWNTTGWSLWTLFITKTRLPSPERISSIFLRLKACPAAVEAPSSPSSTRSLSRWVCKRPRNHVPALDSPL